MAQPTMRLTETLVHWGKKSETQYIATNLYTVDNLYQEVTDSLYVAAGPNASETHA